MTVDASTPLRAEYRGITYYFCSRGCLDKFKATPERYLDARTPEPMEVADRTYTCPMHPEVRQRGPGACPICGMALEPAMVSLEEAPNVELIDMTRRFWIAAALGLPVMAFAMAEMVAPGAAHRAIAPRGANWVQLLLANRWCFGRARRSSCAHGSRSSIAARTCSP